MKLHFICLFVTLLGIANAHPCNNTTLPAFYRSDVDSLDYSSLLEQELEKRSDKSDKVKALKDCLSLMSKLDLKKKGMNLFSKLKGFKGSKGSKDKNGVSKRERSDVSVEKRDLVDDLMVRLFEVLKDSGLVNSIVKMSLTDDEVRPAIIDITIELLRADVIPYEEIFTALRESGLAVDVIKSVVTDPETRSGIIELTKELIPELLRSGVISLPDILGDLFGDLCPNESSSTAVSPIAEVRSAKISSFNSSAVASPM